MDGVSDAGLRMQQIAAQLAALRTGGGTASTGSTAAGATGSSAAATPSSTSGTAGAAGAGATGTPASFGSVLADALANRTGASANTSTASFASTTASVTTTSVPASIADRPAVLAPAVQAVAAPSAGTSTAAVSTDLSHYANGRLPAALLKPVGSGDHRLWAPAADSFKAMAAAAARDGVRLGVNDSYRSYAEQVDMARRKGLYSQGGLAAKPGTSDHGWGKSIDLSLDGRALEWMRAHASQYGFHANVPRENWHWTYKPL
jgi:LAS superfamily LD-carboxypeptidase LdcB